MFIYLLCRILQGRHSQDLCAKLVVAAEDPIGRCNGSRLPEELAGLAARLLSCRQRLAQGCRTIFGLPLRPHDCRDSILP